MFDWKPELQMAEAGQSLESQIRPLYRPGKKAKVVSNTKLLSLINRLACYVCLVSYPQLSHWPLASLLRIYQPSRPYTARVISMLTTTHACWRMLTTTHA
jgi:hypothetical protein